jgi:hypothetical protein
MDQQQRGGGGMEDCAEDRHPGRRVTQE